MNGSSAETSTLRGRIWTFGHFEYNEMRRQLLIRGGVVPMEAKPLDVLQSLLEHPLQVLSKDELLGTAWDTATSDQSLTTAISKLRKVFGGPRDAVILSVSKVGYRMAIPVGCKVNGQSSPAALALKPGDPLPDNEKWIAVRSLGMREAQAVWLAEHTKSHEAHVFKFALDGLRLRSLQREVALSRLFQQTWKNDPRFVKMLSWNFEHPPFFIESEYVGLNLFEFAETPDFKALTLEDRVALVADLAGAVAAAHSLGILHNDLKPGNILVAFREGNPLGAATGGLTQHWQLKVVDFGVSSLNDLSRLFDLGITHHGEFTGEDRADASGIRVGTLMYCAPELLRPNAISNTSADVYSLGVILYQILCGDFLAAPVAGWETRIADPLLRQDIAAAANIDAELRLSSAAELAERLRTLEARRDERRHQEQKLLTRQRAEAAIARQRLRRPWVIAAVCALVLGACCSFWFYRRAVRQRDIAVARANSLAAMNGFLTVDLLSQSNPLTASHGGPVLQETLTEAIDRALPQIDQRFSHDPGIAAQLHMTLAAALDARTDYPASDLEFAAAAQRFREAEGPLAQNAIIAELRRENAQFRSQAAASMDQARTGYAAQKARIAQLPTLSAELQGWQALVESGILIYGPKADGAIDTLKAAIQRAEDTPNFPSGLLSGLRLRFCGVYLKLNKGMEAEQVARRFIAAEGKVKGYDSPALFQARMFLEEALSIQGKHRETEEQSSIDHNDFARTLGPTNQLTLSALYMKAESEGALEQYNQAALDDLAIHDAARAGPSGPFLPEDALLSAAAFECAGGHASSGVAHARQVIRESGPGAAPQPYFVNAGSLTLASCLLGQQEDTRSHPDRAVLDQAGELIKRLDLTAIRSFVGTSSVDGHVALAKARLALLRGDPAEAGMNVAQAKSLLAGIASDPFDQKQMARVQSALQRLIPAQ